MNKRTIYLLVFAVIAFVIVFPGSRISAISSRSKQLNAEGISLMKTGQLEDARSKFKAAIKEDFLYPEPYYNLSLVSRQLGQYEDALKYLNEARQLRPHDEKYLGAIKDHFLFMGKRAMQNRRFKEAEQAVRECLKLNQNNPAATELLVRIFLERNKITGYAKEVEKLEAIVRIPPSGFSKQDLGFSLATLALFHFKTGWYLKAEREARRANKIISDNSRIKEIYRLACGEQNPVLKHLTEAVDLLERGNNSKAEKAFSLAMGSERDRDALAMKITLIKKKDLYKKTYSSAERHYRSGDLEGARKLFEKAQGYCYDEVSSRQVNDRLDAIIKRTFHQKGGKSSRGNADNGGGKDFSSSIYYGDQYFGQGDYEQASKYYQKALEIKPGDALVIEKIQRVQTILGHEQESNNNFKRALSLKGEGKYDESLTLLLELEKLDREFEGLDRVLGEIYSLQGAFDKAIKHCERQLKKNPDDSEALLSLGRSLAQKGDFDRALEVLLRAEEKIGKFREAEKQKVLPLLTKEIEKVKQSITLRKFKRYFLYGLLGAVAVAIFVAIIYLKAALPEWQKKRALGHVQDLIAIKKWKEVETATRHMLEHPGISVSEFKNHQYYLARALMEQKKLDECVEACTELLKTDHRNKRLRVLLANAFIASGTVNEEAFDAYCVLYKLEPNNQRLLELMAQYYSQQEMHDELACEVFRKLAAREPDNKKIVRKYVQVLSARGKVDDEALAAYTRLLQLEPEDNMVRSTLVKGLQQAGEYARAIDECRILLDADPSNMLVHQMFIKSHLNSGKQDKLLEFYDDFLAVFPDNKSVRELVKDLNRKITASQ